jgi:hypothetical protein
MPTDLQIFTKEIFRVAFKKFIRSSVKTINHDEIWGADLVDMSNVKFHNKQTTFLLNIIDLYSRFAYSIPLKSKTGESILNAFKSIDRKPKLLWVDEGKKFNNKDFKDWCKDNNIKMYSTHSGLKSVFVERFNRTMKESFYKMFSNHQTKRYLDFLPKFIGEYNNTIHSSTKAKPEDLYNQEGISHEIVKL